MDPLAALGLRANILFFVQVAEKLVGTAKDIRHSVEGATTDNIDLENVTRALRNHHMRI